MSLQLPCSAVLKYLMLQGIVCFGGGDVWLDWEKDQKWVCFGENGAAPPLYRPGRQNLPGNIRAVALYGAGKYESNQLRTGKRPRDTYDNQRLLYRLMSRLNKP